MSDQPTTAPADPGFLPAPAPVEPQPVEPAPVVDPAPAPVETDTEPPLRVGQLASYVVVDDAGNEHPSLVLVVELFEADGAEHARVVHLGAAAAISPDALTALD